MDFRHSFVVAALYACVVAHAAETFVWDGATPDEGCQWSTNALAVVPRKTLRFDVDWVKREWNFGSAARFRIRWESANGNFLVSTAINSPLTCPPGGRNHPIIEEQTQSAIGVPIHVRAYQVVPDKAVVARIGFAFIGNPCRIDVGSATVVEIDPAAKPWQRRQPKRSQIRYGPVPYTDADVDAALKSRPRAVPRLVRRGDRMELEVDGLPIFPALRHNNRRDPMRGVREFAKIGFRIFNAPTLYFGESTYNGELARLTKNPAAREPQVLREDGTIDVALMERAVRTILREDTNAFVMLVCKMSATDAWKRANPAELEQNAMGEFRIFDTWKFTDEYRKDYPSEPGRGPVPSVFSRKFPADMSGPLAEAFRRFEKTDAAKAVIGVYLTGGDDSQFRLQKDPWTSGLAPRAFRAFLAEKYGTDAALAAAWKLPGATIAAAPIPTRDEFYPDAEFCASRSSHVSDFREFCSYAVARMNTSFRRAVKEGASRLLVGGYSCALTLGGYEGRGRYALARMINDPSTDFVIWLPGYSRRRDEITAPLGLSAYNGSMLLHGKLLISEMDVRYPYGKYLQSAVYSTDRWQETHDDATFSNFLNYMAAAAFAWGGTFHAYPLSFNWYDYPEAMAAWRRAAEIARRARGRPLSPDRIAVIFDDRATDFVSFMPPSEKFMHYQCARNLQVADALWRVGARFDQYMQEDVMSDAFAAVAPKVLLVNDATTLSPERIRAIRARYGRDGRAIVWVGTPGLHSGAVLDEVASAFGLGIAVDDRHVPIRTAKCSDPLCRGVEGFWEGGVVSIDKRRPTAYALVCRGGWTPLAEFYGTDVCAAAVRRTGDFTEVFIGMPGAITPQLMRNICRASGFEPAMDSDDFYISGGGLVVVGACVREGVRRIRLPPDVQRLECLTGQKVDYPEPYVAEVDLPCGAAAVFSVVEK